MTSESQAYTTWSRVELMGRSALTGLAEEVTLLGTTMLRLVVPLPAGTPTPEAAEGGASDAPALTQYYASKAVYCLTPTTQAEAERDAAINLRVLQERGVLPWPDLDIPQYDDGSASRSIADAARQQARASWGSAPIPNRQLATGLVRHRFIDDDRT